MMQNEKFGNAGIIISQDEKACKFLGIWDSGVQKKNAFLNLLWPSQNTLKCCHIENMKYGEPWDAAMENRVRTNPFVITQYCV